MDPDLVELLQRSADRSVAAVDGLRGDVAELRRTFDRDREAQDDRHARLEARVERYGKAIGDLSAQLAHLEETCGKIDKRSSVLVQEEDGPDGETVVSARPASVGVDLKTAIALLTGFCAAVTTPIIVAILNAN